MSHDLLAVLSPTVIVQLQKNKNQKNSLLYFLLIRQI